MNTLDAARGKTFLVTGGNTGIGRATVEALAGAGAKVVVAARSEDKTRPVLDAIRARHPGADLTYLRLDLADLSSVRAAAATFLDAGHALDVLLNNAGLAGSRGLTRDGFELTVGTNHVGPYLFTRLLLPRLREAPQGRLVNVASRAHYRAKGIDFDAQRTSTRSVGGLPEYAVSKLMNVLHAKALARSLAGTAVTTYSLHPGVVASDVWREVPAPFRWIMKRFMISNEEGALTQLRCATDPALAQTSGRYYDAEREKRPARLADDVALQDRLMAWSDEAVGP